MSASGALVAAGRVRDAAGEIYRDGEPGEALYVVVAGAVELRATRRGDATPSLLRTVRSGGTFGEEALLPGLARRATAAAAAPGTQIAEIAGAVARRVLARGNGRDADGRGGDGGGGDDDDDDAARGGREARYLARGAARDVLAGSALGRDLSDDELELLLDGVRLERFTRGDELVHAGDRAEHVYVVAEGLVQLQRDGAVVAYLARGDVLGDDEALAGGACAATAVAAGDTWCAVLPRAVVRTVADRNPGALARWRRVVATSRGDHAAIGAGARAGLPGSTQHALEDLYRLKIARSLLVIDQDTCVRCGHCAWSCADVHGESRLVRRGDKVVTPVDRALGRGGAATLLLPNTCQHCRHAACLHDCPTGAIGRDLDGEVFIRAEACTGCGNCARACPWDNIAMAERGGGAGGRSALAVKCDLCRAYAEPACVAACPTGSVLRVDPERDLVEVARLLRGDGATRAHARTATRASAGGATGRHALVAAAWGAAAALVLGLSVAGWSLGRRWSAGHGAGLGAGVIAGVVVFGLAAHVVPKRLRRLWMKPRDRSQRARPPARSRVRAWTTAHVAAGGIAPAAVLAHADGLGGAGGALALAFGVATALGAFGALVYRALPRALTRIERGGSLPEDLQGDAGELRARLFREMSGTGELVKRIAHRILVPYARAPLGWVALAASGRTLAEEERRLRAEIDRVLEGRGGDRLAGLDPILRVAVEVRALPGRRALTAALRAWMPLHVVAAAVTVALLLVHVALVLR